MWGKLRDTTLDYIDSAQKAVKENSSMASTALTTTLISLGITPMMQQPVKGQEVDSKLVDRPKQEVVVKNTDHIDDEDISDLLDEPVGPEEEDDERYSPDIEITHNLSNGDTSGIEEISSVYRSTTELLHSGVDRLIVSDNPEEQTEEDRLYRSIAVTPALFMLERGLAVASHEYAHRGALEEAGLDDIHFAQMNGDDRKDINPVTAFTTRLSPLISGKSYVVKAPEGEWEELMDDPERGQHAEEYILRFKLAGLNQEEYNAEQLYEGMVHGENHVLDGVTYLANKFGTTFYAIGGENDINDYVERLDNLGVDSSRNEVVMADLVTGMLSNGTMSHLNEIPEYIREGEGDVEPLGIEVDEDVKVLLPGLKSSLTRKGPTGGVKEDVKIGDRRLSLSFEKALSADSYEIGAGYEEEIIEGLRAGLSARYNPESGGERFVAEANYSPIKYVELGAEVSSNRGYTLEGEVERSTPSFEEEDSIEGKASIRVDIPF